MVNSADQSAATIEAQERLYSFPYHHIPIWSDGHFQHYRALIPAYEYAAYIRYLLRRAGESPFRTVLDLGCGDGRLCAELRVKFPGAQITGVDVSSRAIGFAKAFAPSCEFLCGDVNDDEVAKGPFDLIFLVEVLEHIDPALIPEFLCSIQKRLGANGRLILTVPSTNVAVTQKHFQHFDQSLLERTLGPHLRVEEITPLNRRLMFEGLFYRLMGNRFFLLSNERLLAYLFRRYERNSVTAMHTNCRRLLAVCKSKVPSESSETDSNSPAADRRLVVT